jgi:hypothetical protein
MVFNRNSEGKSSLNRWYISNSFHNNTAATIGFDFSKTEYKDAIIELWDSAQVWGFILVNCFIWY